MEFSSPVCVPCLYLARLSLCFVNMKTIFVNIFFRMVYFLMFVSIFFEQAFHQSKNIFVPGFIQYFINGINVASSHLSKAMIKEICKFSSMSPKAHCPSTLCPLLYFPLPILLSSVSTVFPGLPSGTALAYTIISQISQQKMPQSTAVLDLNCNCSLIWLCFKL